MEALVDKAADGRIHDDRTPILKLFFRVHPLIMNERSFAVQQKIKLGLSATLDLSGYRQLQFPAQRLHRILDAVNPCGVFEVDQAVDLLPCSVHTAR